MANALALDERILARMWALKVPEGNERVNLETFVFLSCHNCQEVVQVLNQIALLHPAISHTMVDGSLVPDRMETLGCSRCPWYMVRHMDQRK